MGPNMYNRVNEQLKERSGISRRTSARHARLHPRANENASTAAPADPAHAAVHTPALAKIASKEREGRPRPSSRCGAGARAKKQRVTARANNREWRLKKGGREEERGGEGAVTF